MRVLLSIKPEFVEKIFEGSKKYEFRRSLFKRKDISVVVVYASSPVQKVVGEFTIQSLLSENVEDLWRITEEFSGISKNFYDRYFYNKSTAYAIGIGDTLVYDIPKRLSDFNINQAPQSFCYLD